MAPEALRGDEANELSDVYSFGVILWELITLNFPWAELSSPVQIVAQVAFLHRRLKIPSWVEDPMEQLLHDCWTRETETRPPFTNIVQTLAGDYPSTWSRGEKSRSAEQEAADILTLMSFNGDGSPTSADEDDEFVDASDSIDVSTISAFTPRGLAPIRTPTPVQNHTVSRTLGSEDDSAEESNSLDSSADVSGTNSPRKPPLTPNVAADVAAFRPKILSPLKTPRVRAAGVVDP
jgi:serine/threonine protein kinase